jgi:hypothetical protein
MKTEQASVQMDDELKADINEIRAKDNHSFAKMGYLLLKSAVKERKRLATKNKKQQVANG